MGLLPSVTHWLRLDWMLVILAGWLVVGVVGVAALSA